MADLDDGVDKVAMTLSAFEVRARMAREWIERIASGASEMPWTVRQHFEVDVPTMLTVIEAYRAGQAAAPDGEDVVALGPGDYGKVHAEDIAMVARATGGRVRSAEVIPEYELDDVQAAPDGLSWSEAARLVTADARRIEAKRIALADTDAAPDGPRTWMLPDDRERAKAAIHQPLRDLNVRIVDFGGNCHCNLIVEVVLDALTDATQAGGGDGS